MGIYLAEQTRLFLQAILLGAAFGLLYDAFRISRAAIPTARGVVFAEDLLFFLICAVSTFFFLLRTIDGQIRFFIFIGAGLGLVLYFMTLSILIMGVSKAIIDAVKAVLRFIKKWILLPIWRLIYQIAVLIMRPIRFLGRIIKKNAQKCKYRLKVRRKVLYNQLRSVLAPKPGAKRPKQKPGKQGKLKRKRKRHADDQGQGQEESKP